MKELRIDAITNDIIVFATDRSKRPRDTVKKPELYTEIYKAKHEYEEKCPFCVGNESVADKSTDEVRDENGWIARSVLNKYPILDMESNDIFGVHEVLIENYKHDATFYNMTEEEFKAMFKLIISRYKDLSSREGIEYVLLFKNFLKKAGASLMHPHSQIMSMSLVPPEVENELLIAENYYNINSSNLYDDIVEEEIKLDKRILYKGKKFTVLVPYASKNPGEIRIIFGNGVKLENMNEDDVSELSYVFKRLFKNFEKLYGFIPFNICFHTNPVELDTEKYFNMHMHIFPRKFNFGGFELGSDMYVCSTIPERTADVLKIKDRK